MYGEAIKSLREIIRKLCEMKGVTPIEGAVAIDHIHMLVSIPLKIAVSEFMGYLKGKSALMVFGRHPHFRTQGGRNFWARGCYVATVGNSNASTIREYIKQHEESDKLEDGIK